MPACHTLKIIIWFFFSRWNNDLGCKDPMRENLTGLDVAFYSSGLGKCGDQVNLLVTLCCYVRGSRWCVSEDW